MISKLNTIFAKHQHEPGSLLPILHDVQHALGYVPEDAVPLIANHLNQSRAEVHGVISYYQHFRTTPPPKHVVRLCCAEACQANGCNALFEHAKLQNIEVEPVYCLGLCTLGPAMQIDELKLHARVTPEKFDALIKALGDES